MDKIKQQWRGLSQEFRAVLLILALILFASLVSPGFREGFWGQ